MTTKHKKTSTNEQDKGEAAYQKIQPRLAAVAMPDVPLRVDFEASALAATGVGDRVNAEPLHARFASLPKKEFDLGNLGELPDLAWGLYHAGRQYKLSRSQQSSAKLPADLVQKAMAVEGRMQRLCEYQFPNDPAILALAPGNDYRDLAGDLLGYAKKYREEPEIVASDRVNYREADEADARQLAHDILQLLTSAETKEARAWFVAATQAFLLLEPVYAEVTAAGLWLERADPSASARYPSLYAAGRAPRGAKRAKASDGGGGTAATQGGAAGATTAAGAATQATEGAPAPAATNKA